MKWTQDEIEALCTAYANAPVNELLCLNRLADLFGRHKTNVCRKARALGLTDKKEKMSCTRKHRNLRSSPVTLIARQQLGLESKRTSQSMGTQKAHLE